MIAFYVVPVKNNTSLRPAIVHAESRTQAAEKYGKGQSERTGSIKVYLIQDEYDLFTFEKTVEVRAK